MTLLKYPRAHLEHTSLTKCNFGALPKRLHIALNLLMRRWRVLRSWKTIQQAVANLMKRPTPIQNSWEVPRVRNISPTEGKRVTKVQKTKKMKLRVESGLDIGSNHPFYPSYMIKGKCLHAPLIGTRSKYEKIYVLKYFLSFYLVQWTFQFVRVGEVKHGLVT